LKDDPLIIEVFGAMEMHFHRFTKMNGERKVSKAEDQDVHPLGI